jgi:hypothetical protein
MRRPRMDDLLIWTSGKSLLRHSRVPWCLAAVSDIMSMRNLAKARREASAFGIPPSEWHRYVRDGYDTLLLGDVQGGADSVIVEFGGYLGRFARQAARWTPSEVHTVEPIKPFAGVISATTSRTRVHVHQYTVGNCDSSISLALEREGTGAFGIGMRVRVQQRNIAHFMTEIGAKPIELLIINIEGAEYDLIPILHESGMLARARLIRIQFHNVDGASASLRESCRSLIEESHSEQWDYPFVWESWTRRGAE